MEKIIKPIKINRSNFGTYGDLISTDDINPMDINAGYAKRFDNLANLNNKQALSLYNEMLPILDYNYNLYHELTSEKMYSVFL